MKLTNHHHLVLRLRMHGALFLPPSMPLWYGASLRTGTVLCFYLLFIMQCVLNKKMKNNLYSRKMFYLCCLAALQPFFNASVNKRENEARKIEKKVNRKYVCAFELHYLTCVQLRNSYNICSHLNSKFCVDPDGNSLGYEVERSDLLSDGMDGSK